MLQADMVCTKAEGLECWAVPAAAHVVRAHLSAVEMCIEITLHPWCQFLM